MLSRSEAHETYPVRWRWPGREDAGWQGAFAGEEQETVSVIPLAWQITRALWVGEFGSSPSPACSSDDGLLGYVNDYEAAASAGVQVGMPQVVAGVPTGEEPAAIRPECGRCPAAAADRDRSQSKCKASHMLWVLTPDHSDSPVRVRIPNFAIRPWRRYVKENGDPFRSPLAVVELGSDNWSDQWPDLTVKQVRMLDEERAAFAERVRDDHIWGMLSLGLNTAAASAPEPQRGSFLFDPPSDRSAENAGE